MKHTFPNHESAVRSELQACGRDRSACESSPLRLQGCMHVSSRNRSKTDFKKVVSIHPAFSQREPLLQPVFYIRFVQKATYLSAGCGAGAAGCRRPTAAHRGVSVASWHFNIVIHNPSTSISLHLYTLRRPQWSEVRSYQSFTHSRSFFNHHAVCLTQRKHALVRIHQPEWAYAQLLEERGRER